jgi:hypothetical protein
VERSKGVRNIVDHKYPENRRKKIQIETDGEVSVCS